MKNDEQFFDVRVYGRYVKEGRIAQKDYEKHLKSLPDASGKAATLVIEEEATEEEENAGAEEEEE